MKKWLPLIVLFLLVAGGIWIWSLGSLPVVAEERVILEQAQGDVQVRQDGTTVWSKAVQGQTLQEGSFIKTGAESSAVIDFFAVGESRLDAQASMQIQKIQAETGAAVRLKLESGRVWSRVMRLLDLDSQFLVETSDVVATVRGTAFDVQKTPGSVTTTIWVSESVVDVTVPQARDAEQGGLAIPDGFMIEFGKGSKATSTVRIQEDAMAGAWFQKNTEADAQFRQASVDRLRASLVGRGQASSEGIMGSLRRFSESLHTRLKDEDAASLQARYLLRRLLTLRDMAESGRAGAAYQEFNRVEAQIRGLMAEQDAKQAQAMRRTVLSQGLFLYQDVRSDSAAYRLKQKMEDLSIELAPTTEEKMYRRLLSVDARLDEVIELIADKDVEQAGKNLDVARQALENVQREFKDTSMAMEKEPRLNLGRKTTALVAREKALRGRLDELMNPPQPLVDVLPVPTSTTPTATSTKPVVPPVVSCVSLRVVAQPNPVLVGGRSTITVTAVRADGTTFNASSQATLRLFGNLGTLARNVFTANAAGSVRVEATLACDGRSVVSQASLQINPASVVVKSLSLSGSPTTLEPFQSVTLVAIATYDNGVTKMVTGQAGFQSSDPAVGTVVGGVFQAGQRPGSTTITATYIENGVTVQASLVLTVSLKP